MLFVMSAALGLKDKYTQEHAHRVSVYARRLAKRIRLPAEEIEVTAWGGWLHDIGKLALSERIFSNQKAALSREMLWEVHSHPLIGAALLKRINCANAICEAVLYHHERIDGSGYPFGLKGSSIPLGARIVSVADCFDAITTDRPYQRSKSCEDAFGVLTDMAGNYLSADLVALFIDEIRKKGMYPGTRKPLAAQVSWTAGRSQLLSPAGVPPSV